MQTRKVPIEQLVLDTRCQARADVDHDAVREYAEAYAAGVELPPPEVFGVSGVLYVVNGYHRVPAARKAGVSFLRVEIVGEGTIDEAVWYATAVNQGHGVRRTNADKRRAVVMALENPIGQEQPSLTIAQHVGVSADFVSRLRKEWEDAQSSKGAHVPETTVDSKGRRQPKRKPRRDVSSDETSAPAPQPPTDETSPPDPVEDQEPSRPTTAQPMPDFGPRLVDFASRVREVRIAGLRTIQDGPLLSVRQRVEEHLRKAQASLELAEPVVCGRCQGEGCRYCDARGWLAKGAAAR